MIPYFMDEARLVLPNAVSVRDRTYHALEVVTTTGEELKLGVSRTRMPPKQTLREVVEASLERAQRDLLAYRLLSVEERSYEACAGIEVRLRFVDDSVRGVETPVFHHQFHCVLDAPGGAETRERTWVTFMGSSRLSDVEACDTWMVGVLSSMALRT